MGFKLLLKHFEKIPKSALLCVCDKHPNKATEVCLGCSTTFKYKITEQ